MLSPAYDENRLNGQATSSRVRQESATSHPEMSTAPTAMWCDPAGAGPHHSVDDQPAWYARMMVWSIPLPPLAAAFTRNDTGCPATAVGSATR